ncbi:hypothetical protein BHM03_00000712, partial [Ensete ventricosum]
MIIDKNWFEVSIGITLRFAISTCTPRYGWYIPVRQVTGTRTARYRAKKREKKKREKKMENLEIHRCSPDPDSSPAGFLALRGEKKTTRGLLAK